MVEISVAANYSKQMLDFPQVNFLYYGVESEQWARVSAWLDTMKTDFEKV